ncbi:TSUP family transporter [uncultured Megasphaera sp.]|uniref:TSUP family transporter n=1 Tax=uncultured Megasphaera sp. TaxID=165188 RepID=UPI002657DDA7|nr:TSUP family transporter [uncultured Megasphaera sp.]
MVVNALLGLIVILSTYFLVFYVRDMWRHRHNLGKGKTPVAMGIGFIVDFLDVFGIGSFATTTMLLNATKQLSHDRLLPGTLNAAFAIPVAIEAFIFISAVNVEPITLFSLIFAAVAGAAIGGRIVPRLPEQKVQLGLGIALLITAVLMIGKQAGLIAFLSSGNTAIGLVGWKLGAAVVMNFIFGALMTIGCGLYAPCMVMVFLLGLNPTVAFPVMMGSCAALMPVAAKEFVIAGDYARKVSLCLMTAGIVAVLIATNLVVQMDLSVLTMVITVVVLYTGIMYVRRGMRGLQPVKHDDTVHVVAGK